MLGEIWASFLRLPTWVKVWMVLWLIPVNLASLWFWGEGSPVTGLTVAVLANLGMAFNLPIVLYDRGMGKAMALPHVVFWTPLVLAIVIGLIFRGGDFGYRAYLALLLLTNTISLMFDYKDALDWWRGDRGIT